MQLEDKDIKLICDVLSCSDDEVTNVEPMKIGLTNSSFKFDCKGKSYVLRIPGAETDLFLSRACEVEAEELAKKLGLDETIVYINAETGWKLSEFIPNCDYIDPYDTEGDQAEAMRMLHELHAQNYQGCWEMDFIVRANAYLDVIQNKLGLEFPYADLHAQMTELSKKLDGEGYPRVLCHNDTWFWNYLKDENGRIHLIDWEYAGNNYAAADIADYTVSLQFTDQQYLDLAELYEGHALSEKEIRFYFGQLAICNWHWYIWAFFKEATGVEIEDRELWFGKANRYLVMTQHMFEN